MKVLLLLALVACVVRVAREVARASRRAETERRRLMNDVLATPIECQAADPDVEAFYRTRADNAAQHARCEALRPLLRA